MRCSKCGFISFDQQASCSKCGASQTATPAAYEGTGTKTTPPFFLSAALGANQTAEESPSSLDIEVAVQEESRKEGTAALFEALEAESQGLTLSVEEPETEGPTLDLTPPAAEAATAEEPAITFDEAAEESISLDLDLGLGEEEETSLELGAPEGEEHLREEPPAPEVTSSALEAVPVEEEPLALRFEPEEPVDQVGAPSVGLDEIDLSDLIASKNTTRQSSLAADEIDEEIFDLSALMGDHSAEEPQRGSDDLVLEMDPSLDFGGVDQSEPEGGVQPKTDEEEKSPATKKGEKPAPRPAMESSGLSLEIDEE
ncbi:MAG: hypothetical protein OEV91_07815 [Desulfobulbaceae bacterium]|nr:hypothetical protein [Desulfobulbaceae bacterium]